MLKESAPHHFLIIKVRHAGGASAASLGHERLQAVARDSRFARYCEDNTLADALFSRRLTIISYTVIFSRIY